MDRTRGCSSAKDISNERQKIKGRTKGRGWRQDRGGAKKGGGAKGGRGGAEGGDGHPPPMRRKPLQNKM